MANIKGELVTYLTLTHAIEQHGLELLTKASRLAGDEQLARIYQAHRLQAEEHARHLAERLEAHGASRSDTGKDVEALGIQIAPQPAGGSPATLVMATYALENLEIAAYHLLRGVAERAGDRDTVAAAERILEEAEEAAETLASTFDRALEVSLGERASSPTGHFRTGSSDR